MMRKKYQPLFLTLLLALLLAGCAPAATPYVSIETIVAATYAASVAQTEAARPPATPTPLPPTPTRRPGTATPTPTATFVISSVTPSPTKTDTPEPTATNITSGSGTVLYACNIISTSPKSPHRVKPRDRVQWTWVVENIGTTRWDPSTTDVHFAGGTRMTSNNQADIQSPAKPGSTTTVKINLDVPKEPGVYTTTWAFRKGIHNFCYATIQIDVIE